MRVRPFAVLLAILLASSVREATAAVSSGPERFREANEAVRTGDYPKGTAIYQELAASGLESASLYWNWGQAAAARGALGEALWALLRGREIEPGDAALGREVERLREAANLDRAEISPEPFAALALLSRRFHLALAALAFAALSVILNLASRGASIRGLGGWAWAAFGLAVVLALGPLAASLARPTGVVLRRGAPLLDSASPTADAIGALRDGEVVPILAESSGYVRVEDSSGARGWAVADDVGRLDRPPTRR